MNDCVSTLVEGVFDESLDATYTTYDVACVKPAIVAEVVPAPVKKMFPEVTADAPVPGFPELT